jgi:predicted permease
MREFLARIIDWLRRDRLDRELSDEMRFHREQLERDTHGSADSAHRRFGNVTRAREESRDRWSIPTLDHSLQDLRYALRGLRRSPGFTATAIITLALGIGANAAMFGVVDRLMFRPFAYLRDPDMVHRVYLKATNRGVEEWDYGGEYTRYLDIKRFTTSFSAYAGLARVTMAIGVGDASREQGVGAVSAPFFEFFDARPALGRYFVVAEDSTPRGAEVSVLSYDFWQSEFGGRNILGEKLQVGQIPTTIIGVAPRGFAGVFESSAPAVYIPITLYAGSSTAPGAASSYYRTYNWGWMSTMVRRKPGVSAEQASADVAQAHRRSWEAEDALDPENTPAEIAKPGGAVGSLKTAAGPNPALEARTALWLSGVAVIVLLIACANVANLFLARTLRRQREIAVRLALGVSRARLMRQTLIESLVLSIIGAAAGLLVAQWGGTAIRRMLIASRDASLDTFTDWRTIAMVTGVALISAVLTGIAPALLSARGDLAKTLKAGAREGTYHRSRTRVALLVAQGALSVVLLVGAAMFVRSLGNVKSIRMGYDTDGVLLVSRNLRGTKLDSARLVALRTTLISAAQNIPGVRHAASATSIPFASTSSTDLFVAGIDSVRRLGRFTYQVTTPDFFATFGTRITRGRGFTAADRVGTPRVAVVSEGMARVLWPNRDAIGQCMRVSADSMPCTRIVGIAEDIVQQNNQLTETSRFQYYLPVDQFRPAGGNYLLVRVAGDAALQVESVRKALQQVMPGQSYVTVRPFSEVVDGARRSWQLGATLFVVFGVLALAVAAIGLYGVIAYNVTQRMHELGVRVALGAQRGDILALVVGQGSRFAVGGVVVGCALALSASRWLQPLLFEQSATDPAIFATVAGVMLVVALLACVAPALRAAGADPNTALRAE